MANEKYSGRGRKSDVRRHRQTHGYRGYGSGFARGTERYGGAVHWGSGFGGVGSPAYGGNILPTADLFTSESSAPGSYAGLSPLGYERSDDRIREDICEQLTRRADIDPRRMTVAVQSGEVTLEGAVSDAHARSLAEEIASRSPGVRIVNNRLRLEAPRPDTRPS